MFAAYCKEPARASDAVCTNSLLKKLYGGAGGASQPALTGASAPAGTKSTATEL